MLELQNALYIVPTPIGNMDDITFRACDVLKKADVICAEDTRHSLPLLESIGVKSPKLISFHDHNETEKADKITAIIEEGNSVALISDAGTPMVSDPGYHLVAACVNKGIMVYPLPGACAAITALCSSGMPSDRFSFEGFLPVKEKALHDKLRSLLEEERTMIFYEAPRRIFDTAKALGAVFGDRKVMVARELTKTFETKYYTNCNHLAEELEKDPNVQKGEMVIVLAPYKKKENDNAIPSEAKKLIDILSGELPPKKVCSLVAQMYDLRKNDLYDYLLNQSKTE